MARQQRRHFIDLELCQLNKIYLHNLTNYQKVVNQRNNLLRQLVLLPALKDTLDVWDEQLVRYGCQVIEERRRFVRELNALAGPIHDKLSGQKEKLKLIYEPCVEPESFKKTLQARAGQ